MLLFHSRSPDETVEGVHEASSAVRRHQGGRTSYNSPVECNESIDVQNLQAVLPSIQRTALAAPRSTRLPFPRLPCRIPARLSPQPLLHRLSELAQLKRSHSNFNFPETTSSCSRSTCFSILEDLQSSPDERHNIPVNIGVAPKGESYPAMDKPVKSCAPRKIACADRASP